MTYGVLDAVRSGIIPRARANDLTIASIWLDPAVLEATDYDPRILFATQREAMTKAITKALAQEPSIDWLFEHQDSIEHYFHGLALKGDL